MIATSNNADIVISVIGAAGVMFGALIKLMFGQRTIRHESTRQHADNKEATAKEIGSLSTKLDMVHDSVITTKAELREDIKSLNSRIDKHIENHPSSNRHYSVAESE